MTRERPFVFFSCCAHTAPLLAVCASSDLSPGPTCRRTLLHACVRSSDQRKVVPLWLMKKMLSFLSGGRFGIVFIAGFVEQIIGHVGQPGGVA